MGMRLNPSLLRGVEDPHVVQAILDSTDWQPRNLVYSYEQWTWGLPADQEAFFATGVLGAQIVARNTTDPEMLDKAARDGRITVREAALENPALPDTLVRLIAERAAKRKGEQRSLVAQAFRRCYTAREAIDLVNSPTFNPGSIASVADLGVVLMELILKEANYGELLQEATNPEGMTHHYATQTPLVKVAKHYPNGALSQFGQSLPPHMREPLTMQSYGVAAMIHNPDCLTEADYRNYILPSIREGWTSSHGVCAEKLPGWQMDLLLEEPRHGQHKFHEFVFTSARLSTREEPAEQLDRVVSYLESLPRESLVALSEEDPNKGVRYRHYTVLTSTPLEDLLTPGNHEWTAELLTRIRDLLDRHAQVLGRPTFRQFFWLTTTQKEETLEDLPQDFLDSTLQHLYGPELVSSYPPMGKLTMSKWSKGELPLKPSAAAIAAAWRTKKGEDGVPRTVSYPQEQTAQDIENSVTDADQYLEGMRAAGAAPLGSASSIRRVFTEYFGTAAQAWAIGLKMVHDSLQELPESRMGLVGIAETACVLTGTEPRAHQAESAEAETKPELGMDSTEEAEEPHAGEDPGAGPETDSPTPEETEDPEPEDGEPAMAATSDPEPSQEPTTASVPSGAPEVAKPEGGDSPEDVGGPPTTSVLPDGQVAFAF